MALTYEQASLAAQQAREAADLAFCAALEASELLNKLARSAARARAKAKTTEERDAAITLYSEVDEQQAAAERLHDEYWRLSDLASQSSNRVTALLPHVYR